MQESNIKKKSTEIEDEIYKKYHELMVGLYEDRFDNKRQIKLLETQVNHLQAALVHLNGTKVVRFRKLLLRIKPHLKNPKRFIRHFLRKTKRFVQLISTQGILTTVKKYFNKGNTVNLFQYTHVRNQTALAQDRRYQNWINNIEINYKDKIRHTYKSIIESFEYHPKISVLLPTYNSDEIYLNKAIFSIIRQYYQNWELCISDDDSPNESVKRIIKDFAAKDKRIKYTFGKTSLGISGNTNKAFELATGEFVLFLDHDDELAEEALLEIVRKLNEDKDLDFIYSDNDKIDLYNRRYDPHFKPEYSPELILSYSYTSHIKCVRSKLFKELEGFRSEFDSSQDYEFVLRLFEKTEKIAHIPKVLYHWRSLPSSTASSARSKPESIERGKKAVEGILKSRHVKANVGQSKFAKNHHIGVFNLEYDPKDYNEKVTIIIPTKDKVELLSACIESIEEKTLYNNYEILVINNNSEKKETEDYLKSKEKVKVFNIKTAEYNFALINNEAVKRADSELILFLNNDTEVINPFWLVNMVGTLSLHKKIGSVGARLIYADGRIQHAGVTLGLHDFTAGHSNKLIYYKEPGHWQYNIVMRDFAAVTGACLLTRKSLFESVGGFDDVMFKTSFNDVDYCLKLLDKGYRNVYCPDSMLYHYEGSSRGLGSTPQDIENFRNKWAKYIEYDPYYNLNLSLLNEGFEVSEK